MIPIIAGGRQITGMIQVLAELAKNQRGEQEITVILVLSIIGILDAIFLIIIQLIVII